VRGWVCWVGIELDRVSDEELTLHLREAWRLIAPAKLQAMLEAGPGESNSSKKGSEKEYVISSRGRG